MDQFEQTRRVLAYILIVLISAGWLVPLYAVISLLYALLFTPHLTGVASFDLLRMAFRMAGLAFWWVTIPVMGWSLFGAYKIATHPLHQRSMTKVVLPSMPLIKKEAAKPKASVKPKMAAKKKKA